MRRFFKGERGSMSMEATLVFPFVMVFVLMTVFLCIIVFQSGMTNYVAYQSSNLVAYNYDNSNKTYAGEIKNTSQYTGNEAGDGLYWRIGEGAGDLFDSLGIGGFGGGSGGISQSKKAVVTNNYAGPISIEIADGGGNILIYKKIRVTTESGLYMPDMFKNLLGVSNVTGESTSIITESTEMVRTYNFAKFLMSFTPLEDAGSITEAVEQWVGG